MRLLLLALPNVMQSCAELLAADCMPHVTPYLLPIVGCQHYLAVHTSVMMTLEPHAFLLSVYSQELDIDGCEGMTEAGVRKLQKQLSCEVVRDL